MEPAVFERHIAPLPSWLEAPLETLFSAHQQQRLGHALLIGGSRGLGKMVLARALVGQLLDCAGNGIGAVNHPDLHIVEPTEGKASLGVEQIRSVCGALALTSHGGGSKVALVTPAELMTASAANALLKTLEEPTSQTYLILVSHQPGRLPATIRSRCQTYTVARPDAAVAMAWLAGQTPDQAPDWETLLRYADGAPYRALQLASSDFYKFNNELTKELQGISRGVADPVTVAKRWVKGDPERCLEWLAREIKAFINHLARGNEVTDWGGTTLHNMSTTGSLRALIGQADRLERLRRMLGGGVNTEFALRALLFEFAPNTAGHDE